jgi:hypothetical protein
VICSLDLRLRMRGREPLAFQAPGYLDFSMTYDSS